jgi:hypothetical protein
MDPPGVRGVRVLVSVAAKPSPSKIGIKRVSAYSIVAAGFFSKNRAVFGKSLEKFRRILYVYASIGNNYS